MTHLDHPDLCASKINAVTGKLPDFMYFNKFHVNLQYLYNKMQKVWHFWYLFYSLFYPVTVEGRRGTTDDFAAIPFHILFPFSVSCMIVLLNQKTLRNAQITLVSAFDLGQEYIIFSIRCLDLFENLLICYNGLCTKYQLGGRVKRWSWVNFQCRGVLQFG